MCASQIEYDSQVSYTNLLGRFGVVVKSFIIVREELFVTLIYELNQCVVHLYGGTAGAAMQWGAFQELA